MERHCLQYGDHILEFAVTRRKRATLEIAVEPDSSVVITAPLNASLDSIIQRVRRRAAWIRRQQRFFAQFAPRTPPRLFIAGETHLYLGRQYRLKVVLDARRSVKLLRGFIVVLSDQPDHHEITRNLLNLWYRDRARVKFAERLEINLERFPDAQEFRPHGLIVRQLRQRWGSMSPLGGLVLNRRLIEAPVDAIDYVITHELCHIAENHHSSAFYRLLDRVLPDWRRRKERLEKVMA
jgi:predicted metal-dependent hydrolase